MVPAEAKELDMNLGLIISIVIAVLAFIGMPALTEGFFTNALGRQKRLDYVANMGIKTKKNKKKKSLIDRENIFNLIRVSDSFRTNIELSGLAVRPEEFIITWFLSVFTIGIITFTFTSDILRTVVVTLLVLILPPMYINYMVGRRRKLFQLQLGDALMIIANALRSGFSFAQALSSVSESLSDPIGTEFSVVAREVQLGVEIEEALLGVADRMKSDDLRLLTTAVVVQQQVGGNLSEILDTLSETIRERQKILRTVRTLSAQGKMSGIVVGIIPLVLLATFSVMSPDYVEPMFKTTLGHIILGFAATLQLIGFLVIRKMVDIKL